MLHTLPPIKRRKGYTFILGRVRHRREDPFSYEVRVVRPGYYKVIIGEKGVYILDDVKAEELIRESWERYIREKHGKRKPRSEREVVEHPVEIAEDEIREFFVKRGLLTSFKSCAFLLEGITPKENALKELIETISAKRG